MVELVPTMHRVVVEGAEQRVGMMIRQGRASGE